MLLHKRVVILTILFAVIASSSAAVAVSAQTVSPMTGAEATAASSVAAPSVTPVQLPIASSVSTTSAATFKQPTTFILLASSQSVKLGDETQWVGGYLLSGQKPLVGKTVTLYAKVGSAGWTKLATGSTGTGGWIRWDPSRPTAANEQFKIVYTGTSTYAAATSNIVGVKYENAKTTPYLTYMYAVSLAATVAHGKNVTFNARLMNGLSGLGGKTVTLWYWNGSKWVSLRTLKTLTGRYAGWVAISVKLSKAGTLFLKTTFAGASPYAASTSNTVQLIWT